MLRSSRSRRDDRPRRLLHARPDPRRPAPADVGPGTGRTWLTAETGNNVAPAYYVVAAAIVSLLTILTIRETAGRSLPQGVADEMFQSNADVRGAATAG
jgi:hypothetical protein